MNTRNFKIYVFVFLFMAFFFAAYVAKQVVGYGFEFLIAASSLGAAGFIYSWHNDKPARIANTRKGVDIASVLIILKFAFDCLYLRKAPLNEGLMVLAYLASVNSFNLYKPRDYYFVLMLSLFLFLFSSVISAGFNPNIFIVCIIGFIAIWMCFTKAIELYENISLKPREEFSGDEKMLMFFQLKKIAVFLILIVICAIPIYFAIPRINVPLPLLPGISKNKSSIFVDAINESLASFFSGGRLDAPEEIKRSPEASPEHARAEIFLKVTDEELRPIFWHSRDMGKENLEGLKGRQQDIEKQITGKEADLKNYDNLNNRLQEKMADTKESLAGLQPDIPHQEELKQVAGDRLPLLNKQADLSAKQSLLERAAQEFNNFEDKALGDLQKADTDEKKREALSRIDKFGQATQIIKEKDKAFTLAKDAVMQDVAVNNNKLDNLSQSAQDAPKHNDLVSQLKAIEKEFIDSQIQKQIANSQIEDLTGLYMEAARNAAHQQKESKQTQEAAPKKEEVEKKEFQQQAGLFFEKNPLFLKAASLIINIILWLSIFMLAVFTAYLLYRIILFVDAGRKKQKALEGLVSSDPRQFIILLYGFLLDVLAAYGYKRKEYMDVFEYMGFMAGKIGYINRPLKYMSECFQEARYSTHDMDLNCAKNFALQYEEAISLITKNATARQSVLLKLKYPFLKLQLL